MCGEAALRARGLHVAEGIPFERLAEWKAVLEVDGLGYQASLLAKLTLGSIVISPSSLFPTWYEPLLQHKVRRPHTLRSSIASCHPRR